VSTSQIPEVVAVASAAVRDDRPIPVTRVDADERPRRGLGRFLWDCLSFVVGWSWRLLVGALLCFNWFILSFITSIVVLGWTYRWMQMLVLRGWWKQSRQRARGTFADFCAGLIAQAPAPRPRWFLRERIGQALLRPAPGGGTPGPFRLLLRLLSIPWHSLWLNFKIGVQAIFCTNLLVGWGCLMMLVSWEFGWLNSFHKGYEQAWIGPLTGIVGSLLLMAAMFYVPMAQAHQAATGQARAFFEFRLVWQLIRARLTAYVFLAMLIALASLIFNILILVPVAENFAGNAAATPELGLAAYWQYSFWCSLFVFLTWLLLHYVAAVIYRSAVLKALRRGTVTRGELHPLLGMWIQQLQLDVTPRAATVGLGWYARLTARFAYRRVLFTMLFLVWLTFVVRFYAGYFFRADPYLAFLNHPMIQLPCFDYIPPHLYLGYDD
jgi:hypothetical protein